MNQLYRALHMGPTRLLKKIFGWDEIYTVGYRPLTPGKTLPETGGGVFSALPFDPDFWYADPLLFDHEGESFLFTEAYDKRRGKGLIAVSRFVDGAPTPPTPVLEADVHLSFPLVFRWRSEIWMLPETGTAHQLRLYRCSHFPDQWTLAQSFDVGMEACDTILTAQTEDRLELLCSETLPENQLQVRYRRFSVTAGADGFALAADDKFNAAQSYNYNDRNAGPIFALNGQDTRPAQESTSIDYGVRLRFWQDDTDLCCVECKDITLSGVPRGEMVGVHTYCRDARWEIIDLRYARFEPRKWLWKLRQKH